MATFIAADFNKAYDFIDGHAIPIGLSKYGTSELLIANVMQFYIWTSALVATEHRSQHYLADRIGALMYAYDITITCDTIDQAENVTCHLKMNASKVGLKIN